MDRVAKIDNALLINADSLQYIKTLPDNSIDLIATDPPYYRVKSCGWDNQWKTREDYLSWLNELVAEFWRVLKPSGSLYMFCGSRLAADTELLVREHFDVLSHIIWAKPSGPWLRQNKESLRAYFPATERIIFAAHYSGPYRPKGDEWSLRRRNAKQQAFGPLIDYFRNAKNALGISAAEINAATGTKMCSHWFSESQWQLPAEAHYLQLQALFRRVAADRLKTTILDIPHAALADRWQVLNREYADLMLESEHLRRPFSVTADVPYTDVWTFAPVAYYPGKHPCEKPAAMMDHIIRTSSRPGDTVADFFMGSGSTVKSALRLGRSATGVELEEERFRTTCEEVRKQFCADSITADS